MKGRTGGDQDRCVEEEREHQRAVRVTHILADRAPLGRVGEGAAGRREQAAMQVEIVRHHRGADDPDAEQQHRRIGHELARRQQSRRHVRPDRLGEPQQDNEAHRHNQDHAAHQSAQPAPVVAAIEQDREGHGAGQQHAGHQADTEQEF